MGKVSLEGGLPRLQSDYGNAAAYGTLHCRSQRVSIHRGQGRVPQRILLPCAEAHVIELYELSDEDSAAFMRDVKVASLALKKVTTAVKINYEIHGNTIPHMHMHLYPRQIGDPFENGPIDWRRRTAKTYEDGEFDAFIERMKTALKEVEQGAATGAAMRRR